MPTTVMKKIRCLLRGHDYSLLEGDKKRSTNEYLRCYAFRKCATCGKLAKYSSLFEHYYGDYQEQTDKPCTFLRTCTICGATDEKVNHAEFKLVETKENCLYKKICVLCGAEMGEVVKHGNSHAVESSNPCIESRVCDRCGTAFGEIDRHKYGPSYEARIQVDDDYFPCRAANCTRCGHRKVIP